MAEYKSEVIVELSTPALYHNGGQIAEGFEVILKAPSNLVRRQTAQLKQGFFRAVSSIQKGGETVDDTPSDGDIKGSQVLAIIMMSNVDYFEYTEIFLSLLLQGVASISENGIPVQKVTKPILDSFSEEDIEKLMEVYFDSFLLSSWMKVLSQK